MRRSRLRPGRDARFACRWPEMSADGGEMATKAAEYKATLFDQSRPSREKAIANCPERAHDKSMHKNQVGPELCATRIVV
jgi:hypothetical protein